jgi:hypothetical protein
VATSAAARRVTFFLAFSVCLIAASLVVELLWRGHLREAIALGPLTPRQMQSEIATELQMFGIGMKALAIVRTLVAIPTAVFWLLWLLRVIRRAAVVGLWSVCTVATVAVTVSSIRAARTVASHAGPGLPREAMLEILSQAADISIRTDLALLVLAVAALALVRAVTRREPSSKQPARV